MYNNTFTCVVCGHSIEALYKQYGPTVIKLTTCPRCGSISDKYIEYDPVIIMVDLVLLSKDAYRHVLYNTPFKSYWKLFIVLIALETYTEWSNQIHRAKSKQLECYISHNPHSLLCNSSTGDFLNTGCNEAENKVICHNVSYSNKFDKGKYLNDDPFLTEKGVYVTFCCVCGGMLVFSVAVFTLSIFLGLTHLQQSKVTFLGLVKGLTLGGMGNLLMLPTIIWGSDHDTSIHAPLVLAYTTLALVYIHSVIFECSKVATFLILSLAFIMKVTSKSYLRNIATSLMET